MIPIYWRLTSWQVTFLTSEEAAQLCNLAQHVKLRPDPLREYLRTRCSR